MENLEIENRLSRRQSRCAQAFPGFKLTSLTFLITCLQVFIYTLSVLIGSDGLFDPSRSSLLLLGANVKFKQNMEKVLQEKEIWRLVTSLFLHGNFMHLLINVFSQLRLCFMMEKYYKPGRYFLIYLISGVGGNLLAGYVYPSNVLVGSSTALFGIFGTFGCYFMYNWNILGPGRNLNLIIYLFFVVVSLELPITLASVDIAGHLGGFAVGIFLGFFLLPREERSETWDVVLIVNGILVLLYFVVIIWLLSYISIEDLDKNS